jgi:3-hydroxymyristoyl/3-hydroxydecanoyl-(acyl carrier protein) dehydratase
MQSIVGQNLGYANQGALPGWMTSPQANQKVLGFTRCIVLAYTVPPSQNNGVSAAELIAYRLQNTGIKFNMIDFVADRYDLDNALTVTDYNVAEQSFVSGSETTFDRIYRGGQISYVVDYAVTSIPFNQINNQTVSSIISTFNGLDGVTNITNGQKLIFAQQEDFNVGTNDGWTFPDGSVVPGYLESLYNNTVANQRGGIWQINIVNNVVNLTFVNSVTPGNRIQVNLGRTYASTVVFYNPSLQPGQTVPTYSRVTSSGIPNVTIFDNNNTLFVPNRDVYQKPGQGDSYLKFPKSTVFQ